jgi:tripartite-type tricarboxylate transporter receptor subunit TctC
MALLSQRAGMKLTHVPYRGGGPAMNDAVAVTSIFSTALSMLQVEGGTIRAIVQTGKERNQFIAQVPTVAKSGFPGFEAYAWWGIFAPAGTPKPIIERFGNEMAATLREQRIAEQSVETQQVSLILDDPEAERAFVGNQMQTWGKVAKDNNVKPDQN